MPDHAGDRGAVLLALEPHDHLHIRHDRSARHMRRGCVRDLLALRTICRCARGDRLGWRTGRRLCKLVPAPDDRARPGDGRDLATHTRSLPACFRWPPLPRPLGGGLWGSQARAARPPGWAAGPVPGRCGYNPDTGKTTLIVLLNTVPTGPSFPLNVGLRRLRAVPPAKRSTTERDHVGHALSRGIRTDRFDAERVSELVAAGRRFRVVRLERLVRTGRTSPRRHVRPIPIRSRPSWCRHSDCASKGCPWPTTRTRARKCRSS
jgi:hypothetical protein